VETTRAERSDDWPPQVLLAGVLIAVAALLKPSGLAVLVWIAAVLVLALPVSLLIAYWSRDDVRPEEDAQDEVPPEFLVGGLEPPAPRPVRPRPFRPS